MGKLADKVAVVTGGSQGIGLAFARAFAKEGAAVVISGRRDDVLQAAAEQLRSQGARIIAIQGNTAKREDANRTIAAAVENFGRLDILVNNAQAASHGNIEDITDEGMDLTFGSGFRGVIYHMQAALPYLKVRGGSVLNMGSRQGIYGQPGDSLYGANKEAIRALTRAAAREWGHMGIRVNVMCPAGASPALENFVKADPVRAQKYIDEMPLGRFGRLDEDIAPIAVFLASDDGQYVTGQTINADGGQVML